MLRALVKSLRKDTRGQDLAEYCLLTAVVVLVALAVVIHVCGGIQGVWSTGGSTLGAANVATSGSGASPSAASTSSGSR